MKPTPMLFRNLATRTPASFCRLNWRGGVWLALVAGLVWAGVSAQAQFSADNQTNIVGNTIGEINDWTDGGSEIDYTVGGFRTWA